MLFNAHLRTGQCLVVSLGTMMCFTHQAMHFSKCGWEGKWHIVALYLMAWRHSFTECNTFEKPSS